MKVKTGAIQTAVRKQKEGRFGGQQWWCPAGLSSRAPLPPQTERLTHRLVRRKGLQTDVRGASRVVVSSRAALLLQRDGNSSTEGRFVECVLETC